MLKTGLLCCVLGFGILFASSPPNAQSLNYVGEVNFPNTPFIGNPNFLVGGSDVWGYTAPN
ncbi:MAG: hypothetical protein R3284_02035, partial [Rubricoccaceae bacterium]|nr:hypothetical protein [Rubricoccaceae bacterium]